MISESLTALVQNLIPDARVETLDIPSTDIKLFLINEDYPQHALPNEVAYQLMEQPLYWAFCWASGAVLAHYILQNSATVKNKTVLDFGSGSGVVAIAAAKAGAKRVVACDIDSNALIAIKENSQLNGVSIELCEDFNQIEEKFDLLTAADVLYDRDNLPWLDKFAEQASHIFMADSRIKNFDHPSYSRIGQYESCTLPDLDESSAFRLVSIYKSNLR